MRAAESQSNFQRLVSSLRGAKSLTIINKLNSEIIKDGLQSDQYLGNNLVKVYGTWGRLAEAREAFERITRKTVYSWTIIISAYVQNGKCGEAIALFRRMQREGVLPNQVTHTAVLSACASLKLLPLGRSIHAQVRNSSQPPDLVMENTLINMYSKCGSLIEARRAFNSMKQRDVVSWTSLITAYSENGKWKRAIQLFWKMVDESSGVQPVEATCMSVLGACLGLGELSETRRVHQHITSSLSVLERKITVANKLIFTYGKCGSPSDARRVFDRMEHQNTVSWTSMIAAYTQNSKPKSAIKLFMENHRAGVKFVDDVTYLNVLEACSAVGSLHLARKIHARVESDGFLSELKVATAIITMYSKCGSLIEARRMFDAMPVRSIVSWNVMMAAYTHHGETNKTLELFKLSCLEGVSPNVITFITLLFSCSHAGLVKEGCEIFSFIKKDFGVEYCDDHYVCVVDMLGRAGWIEEADEVMLKFMPDGVRCSAFVSSMTLLAACRVQGDLERAGRVCGEVLAQEPVDGESSPALVLMSNLYSC